ncbi:leucyl aminopeptidase [Alteromonas naphthalenivorans]|uniref:Probable cytosol aminopeptidase n=1 Tax=Alteromonas naphthalenivorans TaxID=715451 RepID=F5ZA98_ALTNA|nr:leucyl aminopeptidase [Alteromonas naphthalenivorans]AEF01789.1 multifunctional aminopeptidase A [Alteromonas naphthalenivorans]
MTNVTLAPHRNLHEVVADCVIWLCSPTDIQPTIENMPHSTQAFIQQIFNDEEFVGSQGQKVLLHRPVETAAKRWLIWGAGNLEENISLSFDHPSASHGTRKLFVDMFKYALSLKAATITLVLPWGTTYSAISHTTSLTMHSASKQRELGISLVRQLLRAIHFCCYQFKGYKSSPHLLSNVMPSLNIQVSSTDVAANLVLDKALNEASVEALNGDSALASDNTSDALLACVNYEAALANGMGLARDLSHMPANLCTPVYLADQATILADAYSKITTEIIDQDTLESLGMNAYLAVNRASAFPASMPVIRYSGNGATQSNDAKNTKPVVLIGKGVTFDSGGITLKRGGDMHHMIYDMAGAACVLGVIKAVAELGLNINIIGILATAENSIGGNAYRPGDIITTHSKQTVEVISTDAEGRMLMCDALSYSERFAPHSVIDIATLTGAAITALGYQCSSVMSNSRPLEQALIKAGEHAQDPIWPFPLWPEYQDAIASSHADMTNAGKNSPGMITAGCFLSRFAKNFSWAHMDVAGTAFKYGTANSATGRPIPLLVAYLQRLATVQKSS